MTSELIPKSQIIKKFDGYFHCTGDCDRCTETDCEYREKNHEEEPSS